MPADRTVGWEDDPFADPFSDELPFEVAPESVFLALPMGTSVFSGASESPIATIALPLASQVLGLLVCVGWAAYAYMDTPVLLSNGEVELDRVLPIVGATLALQALHEGAHLAAAMRHRLELSLPFVIPSSMLGLGGGHMPLAEFPQNRTQLYDFALAGPLTGGLASGALFLLGLGLTSSASPEAAALFPQLPTTTLHASLLASLAVEIGLGLPFGAETVGSCALHPFALAGLGGLFANALAMLPVGRLDGGRAAIAAYGRRTGATLGALALLLLALACSLSESPAVLLVWSALSAGLFRQAEVLCVDEVSEIDTTRSNALLPLLVLAALFLIPLPGGDDASAAFGELARVTAGDSQLW
jgi:membrane-associated protease RseP (regulator of RpoE activity)